jgi:carboxylesterase
MQATIRTNLHSYPRPSSGYFAAVQRVTAMQNQDTREINSVCCTNLLTHNETTDRAIVFMHGLTSCPAQFAQLGKTFFELGYNVFLPRMPHHGYANRLTSSLAQLTAPQLATFADEVVDIAQGLGRKVYVMGLSVGGMVTGWVAQYRTDVERAVLVSPLMWPHGVNPSLKKHVGLLARFLPNTWRWWDAAKKQNRDAPGYSYPRFPTRAVAHCLKMAQSVLDASRLKKPAAQYITVVTNANDHVVDNETTYALVNNWRKTHAEDPQRIESFEFEARMNLTHDLIAPEHPLQQIENVYPALIKLVNR